MSVTGAPMEASLPDRVRLWRRLPAPGVARAIRDAAGVSQQDVADELGVYRVTVARWELGTRVPRGTLRERYVALLDQLQQITSEDL